MSHPHNPSSKNPHTNWSSKWYVFTRFTNKEMLIQPPHRMHRSQSPVTGKTIFITLLFKVPLYYIPLRIHSTKEELLMWTCILEVTDIQLCNATEKGKHVKHTEFLHLYRTPYSDTHTIWYFQSIRRNIYTWQWYSLPIPFGVSRFITYFLHVWHAKNK